MATGSDWADFRREGCQATDHCSRQRFNICWHKDHWISLMRWWEIFHLRLWQGYQIILTRCQNDFRPHLCFKPKQIFLKPNTVFFVLKPNQTVKHTRQIEKCKEKNEEHRKQAIDFSQIPAWSIERGDINLSLTTFPQLHRWQEHLREEDEHGKQPSGRFDVILTAASLKAMLRHTVLKMTYLWLTWWRIPVRTQFQNCPRFQEVGRFICESHQSWLLVEKSWRAFWFEAAFVRLSAPPFFFPPH